MFDGGCLPQTRALVITALFGMVPWYVMPAKSQVTKQMTVERVQTGLRIEKRILKVLKALGELKDISVGDLLEGIVLHAFDGKLAFTSETLKQIAEFKSIYGLTLDAADSHKLREKTGARQK